MTKPRAGEQWHVEVFRRTYWTQSTVTLVREYRGCDSGWIVTLGATGTGSEMAIPYAHIRWIEKE